MSALQCIRKLLAVLHGLGGLTSVSLDPRPHRFIAEDLVEFQSGDTNLYAYVRNRPTAFADPYGESIPL